MNRCKWVNLKNQKYVDYHDKVWGVPVYDDNELFEFLVLEGAQAGLTWETILNRREEYQKVYKNFDPKVVSEFDHKYVEYMLSNDSGIIKNKLKVKSSIQNAKEFLNIQKEFGSFKNYIWSFTDNKVVKNNYNNLGEIPPQTDLSNKISKDLKKRGFNFVGPTIIYAYLQAIGIVNDHTTDCFLYQP